MATAILGIIGSLLVVAIAIIKFLNRQKAEKRKQAEQARKDLDNANSENGNASDFLDAFGRMR